jgi:hypothetical protein
MPLLSHLSPRGTSVSVDAEIECSEELLLLLLVRSIDMRLTISISEVDLYLSWDLKQEGTSAPFLDVRRKECVDGGGVRPPAGMSGLDARAQIHGLFAAWSAMLLWWRR